MNKLKTIEQEIIDKRNHLKYLKFGMVNGKYFVTLKDVAGYEIVRGFGDSITEAINDMHRGLI